MKHRTSELSGALATAKAVNLLAQVPQLRDFDVRVSAPRAYKGRQARRAAFAHRARVARVVLRVLRERQEEWMTRYRNLIVYGTTYPEVYLS